MNALLNKKDEIIMSLVHYFVTEENYTPINVQGAQDEIWLENLEAPYKIIRINSKYIHNNDQYSMDLFKMKYVIKQIKRKTLSLKLNVLNICLDMSDYVDLKNTEDIDKNIATITANSLNEIKKNEVVSNVYPKLKTNEFKKNINIEQVIRVTDDINNKTIKENEQYEKVFKPKFIIITKLLILINIVIFLLSYYYPEILDLGLNQREYVLKGEYYRLISCAFLHANPIHIIVNTYSLWIIGSQVEQYIGKIKFIIIYILSALLGSLLSVIFSTTPSVGASGALFGLMGALLYFGYHYRLYLSNALIKELIPIIIANLALGLMIPGIDNFAHMGGLIGGYLSTMAVGLTYKSKISERINGTIVYLILTVFLLYVLFYLI